MLSSTNFKKMPNLKIFNKLLLTSNPISNVTYISKHNKINNLNTLRCYKSYNNSNDLICNLDYIINSEKKYVKIDYLSINNDYYDKKYNHKLDIYSKTKDEIFLNEIEVKILKNTLIKFIENIAIKNNIKKITIDVNNNLERYNNELKEEGFILTKNTNKDYKKFIEAEKKIDIDNNLERFNLELKDGEFIVTNNRSYDNPFWCKAEKNI